MKRSLITFGFLKMMLPPTKPLAPDPVIAATLARRLEDVRWREYDFPAYRRFVSDRQRRIKTLPVVETENLSSLLRRQAE